MSDPDATRRQRTKVVPRKVITPFALEAEGDFCFCPQRNTNMKKKIVTPNIQKMVRRLVDRFDPDQIILFGSHARGTAGPDSDIDLLVIMPVTGSKRAKQIEMRVALHDIRVPKDIILATPDQVARQKDIVGTIIRPALREGQVLYVRTR
jgi:predicted nucleotidyltransferase